MHFYRNCILHHVFSTTVAGQSCWQPVAWWIQNSVSLSLCFSPSLCFLAYNFIIYSSFPFLLCCVCFSWWSFFFFFFPPLFCSWGQTQLLLSHNVNQNPFQFSWCLYQTWSVSEDDFNYHTWKQKIEWISSRLQIFPFNLTWSISWVPFQCFYILKSMQLCSVLTQF